MTTCRDRSRGHREGYDHDGKQRAAACCLARSRRAAGERAGRVRNREPMSDGLTWKLSPSCRS